MTRKSKTAATSKKDNKAIEDKRAAGKELFAKMAKIKTYPIDNRPVGTVDDVTGTVTHVRDGDIIEAGKIPTNT